MCAALTPTRYSPSFAQCIFSKQLRNHPPIVHQPKRLPFAVDGGPVSHAHGVEDGPGNVLGADGVVRGVLGAAVAGAVDAPALDAAAGEEDRHAHGPVVAAGAAAALVADLGLAAHL